MADLPHGTVTFLFTDIEGSTGLWERDRTAMRAAVDQHLALLRDTIAALGGVAFKTVGDAVQAAFATAPPALAAGVASQRALQVESWPEATGALRVRMALHAGMAEPVDGDYLAPCLNRLSRLLGAGHGQQVLLTETVRRLLEGELPAGVSLRALGSHGLRDLLEPEEIFQVLAPGLPEQFPPLRSLPSHPTNLTAPPTALIGRDDELAAVGRLLGPESSRLVTLTGAGGTGKTRLAMEVAAEALDRFPDGVFVVDLSLLTEPALVVPAIAIALGVRETAGEPLRETLIRYLRQRHLLLMLDNCEQVLESASDIAPLLAGCPHLSILATSREPLHIRAEREIAVAPLPLPEPGQLPPVAELAGVAAVALFVERAQAAHASFTLTAENATAVAGICQRLDGLPLAIELAAARVKVLPPAALLARLEQRLPLLTGGGRDLPARQRTMRDAIAWSYDLLITEEQGVFRQLAVFAGGCTLEAAEAVAGQEGAVDVFANIAALIESSLLRQEEDRTDEPRFRMLETVREYGLEQLASAGEADGAQQRHAQYFWRLSESQAHRTPLLVTLERVARLVSDQENLRLALAWYDQRAESDTLLQLSTALYGLWSTQGLYREGMQWIERALEQSSRIAIGPRVEALVAASRLATFLDDYARAAMSITEGLALARELGDPFLVAQVLSNAGFLSYRRGDYDLAETQLGEARQLLSGISDSVPDAVRVSTVPFQLLGDTAMAREQFDLAAARYAEAIEVAQTVGTVWSAVDAQIGLAAVNYCTGNAVRAAALYINNLHRAQDVGVKSLVASALLGMAGVATAVGRPEEGARLLAAAEGSAASLGAPIFPRDRPVRDRALAALAAALGEQQLGALREAGRAMTIEVAIREAEAVAARTMPAPPELVPAQP
jgi:predicted ATPase/class 3 adenylate cyclase